MNLPSLIPDPWRLAARLALAGFLLLTLYTLGHHDGAARVQQRWDAAKVAATQAQLAAEHTARQREQLILQRLQKADHDAAQREIAHRAAADAAATAAGQLRHTVTDLRRRLSIATVESCRATAETALIVFSECTDQYRALAATADGHASDVQTLTDAWPR